MFNYLQSRILWSWLLDKFCTYFFTNTHSAPKWFWAFLPLYCLLVFSKFVTKQGELCRVFVTKWCKAYPKGRTSNPLPRRGEISLFLLLYSHFFCWNFFHCHKFKRVSWTWFFICFFLSYIWSYFSTIPCMQRRLGLPTLALQVKRS